MRKFLFVLLASLLAACQPALAQIVPSLPYNLTNGTLADATQVMGNFNALLNGVNNNGAANGANNDITSLTGLTTPLAHTYGGTVIYSGGTSAGSANAQTLSTTTPSNYSKTLNNIVTFVAGYTNTSSATFNVDSTGAVAIDKATSSGVTALGGGEIVAGLSYAAMYDGTEYILLNPTFAYSTNFNVSAGTFDFSTQPVLPASTTATTQAALDNSTRIATTAYVDGRAGYNLQVFTSTGANTFTTPSTTHATTTFKFTCTGGGGAGGGSLNSGSNGTGGTAGSTAIYYISNLSSSTGYTITVGTGGTGGADTAGGNGGNSTIAIGATTVTAPGGTGGPKDEGTGGTGGTCTNATVCYLGGSGGQGTDYSGGAGGASMWGGGGHSASRNGTPGNGGAGVAYGSGGGGAATSSGTGGAGANGYCQVEWWQ